MFTINVIRKCQSQDARSIADARSRKTHKDAGARRTKMQELDRRKTDADTRRTKHSFGLRLVISVPVFSKVSKCAIVFYCHN